MVNTIIFVEYCLGTDKERDIAQEREGDIKYNSSSKDINQRLSGKLLASRLNGTGSEESLAQSRYHRLISEKFLAVFGAVILINAIELKDRLPFVFLDFVEVAEENRHRPPTVIVIELLWLDISSFNVSYKGTFNLRFEK